MGLIPPEVTIEAAREIGDDFGLRNMIEATPSLHDAPPPPLAGVSFLRGGETPPGESRHTFELASGLCLLSGRPITKRHICLATHFGNSAEPDAGPEVDQ